MLATVVCRQDGFGASFSEVRVPGRSRSQANPHKCTANKIANNCMDYVRNELRAVAGDAKDVEEWR